MTLTRKPWEEYPHIWKTESQFWTYLRGGLRRALWEKSPIKLEYKNKACTAPPEGYTGRAKSGAYCSLSGEWAGKSALECDHIIGNVSLRCWEDVLPFILHLLPKQGTITLVTKNAHKTKSYAEKMGISFDEAVLDKKVIAICKDSQYCFSFIKSKGVTPEKNAKLRRTQVKAILEQEMKDGE